MKKISIFCICILFFWLNGCFHVPDKDWLLSDSENKKSIETNTNQQEFNNSINTILNALWKKDSEENFEMSRDDNITEIEILPDILNEISIDNSVNEMVDVSINNEISENTKAKQ